MSPDKSIQKSMPMLASRMFLTNNDLAMNVSTATPESSLEGMPTLRTASISGSIIPESIDPDVLARLNEAPDLYRFKGRLVIPGRESLLPEQEFTIEVNENGVKFENHPIDSWPKIEIKFAPTSKGLEIQKFVIIPLEYSVEAGILLTRLLFGLHSAGRVVLPEAQTKGLIGLEIQIMPPSVDEDILDLARQFRKLKYIEQAFNVKFMLPDRGTQKDVIMIDMIFRGITEGEFSMRQEWVTFLGLSPTEIDLNIPPFNAPGQFSRVIENHAELFGRELPVGPITIKLDKAELASPSAVYQIQKGSTEPLDVKFSVYDHQVIYRFESYAQQPRRQRMQRLNRFKYELAQKEPKELVDLITEPLQRDVSPDEARQIAVGWHIYNDLPDRISPQDPILDEESDGWRVPIHLSNRGGESISLGEILIHKKTGKIIKHTPVEEVCSKGLALAEKLLHA